MQIKIDNYIHNISCRPSQRVKVYAVPEEYSEDRLFVAAWAHDEIEPYPACLCSDAALLADVSAQTGQDGQLIFNGFMADGVEINA